MDISELSVTVISYCHAEWNDRPSPWLFFDQDCAMQASQVLYCSHTFLSPPCFLSLQLFAVFLTYLSHPDPRYCVKHPFAIAVTSVQIAVLRGSQKSI